MLSKTKCYALSVVDSKYLFNDNKWYWLIKIMEPLECHLLHLPVNLLTQGAVGAGEVNMWNHQISWSEEKLFETPMRLQSYVRGE